MVLGACLFVMILVACGGAQGDPVVRVANKAITKAEVSQFMSVVAAEASTVPGQPKFATPQPPGYGACISYLKRYPTFGSLAEKGHSYAALKFACEFEYRKERLKALYILIGFDWVSGQATELGVKVTDRELQQALTAFEHQRFPSGGFRSFLASTRLTRSDVSKEVEQALLVDAVQHELEGRPSVQALSTQQRQLALNEFSRGYERRWKARTNCQRGYVVPICRQYVAPKTPSGIVPNAMPLTDLAAK